MQIKSKTHRSALMPRAIFLFTTALVLPAFFVEDVAAQQQLPTVSVQAPRQRAARPQPVRRVARRAPAPRPVARPAAPVGPTVAGERANGPVNGIVARQSATGSKTDTPILETPQSVAVVPREQIVQQGAQTIAQSIRYVSGAQGDLYGAGSVFDTEVKVRGFVAPRYLDGLRLPYDSTIQFAQPRTEPYGLERIEILKGPASGIYGQASPGGILNMVSKRPTTEQRGELEFQTGSYGRIQGAFDISGPIDKDRQFLYRIVGLGRDSDTFINGNHENRYYIAPSFTWQPNIDTSFTVLASAQRDRLDGQIHQYLPGFGTLYSNPNGRISRSTYTGEPGFDRVAFDQAFIGYELKHRFNEMFEFRQNVRAGQADIETFSMRNRNGLCPLPGNPLCAFDAYDPAQRITTRDANYVGGSSKNFAIDNQLQADFQTGFLRHRMLFGIDYQKTEITTDYRGTFAGFPIDVYNPVYGATPLPTKATMIPFFNYTTNKDQLGFYIQDQIKFDRFNLTLTGRHDKASSEVANNLTGGLVNQDDSRFTGRVGLNYVFDSGFAPYVSYSTSFEPVAGLSLVSATGEPFKPTTGEGFEAGIKYAPPGTKMLFTAAYFDIKQKNVVVNTPLFIPFQVGGIRVKGVEADFRAELMDGLDLIAGASHQKPIVEEHIDPTLVGKDVSGVNRDAAFLWAFYTAKNGPFAGLGIGGGVRYTGALWGDDANLIRIPSYTLFDAALTYDFKHLRPEWKGFHLRVNAFNVGDKVYINNCFTGVQYCAYGQPRTVYATLSYRWGEAQAPLITKY
ncbi:ferrichrome-iron receptor precursor [Variibacter gotjawalensis]|uniref:Ferrichrome-iron receptor n=1 Tax=Variibacter gotjawalensis TaxID=1333996 RepID=A0A0S3Q096_9BRAD|nr:TonB-dependent siderophore receptor [Variibacter gotjawalensis]NIK47440.1 iron complex outermembrane receptor protein [Variibacter gotjawalensis]RZS49335.1 iron complex outermembrane receptor protein [Variibacter gotjawalensis]BAT61599.1 ferrichrome-iron receptor precursor [Variibacter gotjawalensis]